ncbi:MAG: OsmC family protein [Spirochaetales bacterium]
MTVHLQRVNSAAHLEARNSNGNTVHIDGAPAIGGQNAGFRPMETLLAAVGSCASMDLVAILTKQRQRLDDLSVRIDGTRKQGDAPHPFTAIHVHFDLKGAIDEKRAERAVSLSVDKYCSVKESLDPNIDVTHSFTVEQTSVEPKPHDR